MGTKAPKNSEELRDAVLNLFADVKDDKTDLPKAKILIAASNAAMKTVVAELEHHKLTGDTSAIKFLKKKTS